MLWNELATFPVDETRAGWVVQIKENAAGAADYAAHLCCDWDAGRLDISLADLCRTLAILGFGYRVRASRLGDRERDAFCTGWEAAGGYVDDYESDTPWCAPWYFDAYVLCVGGCPEQWGADWWYVCRPEIERLLAEEKEEE